MKRLPKADHLSQAAGELARTQEELKLAQRSRLLLMTTLERSNSENAALRAEIADLQKRLDDTTRALREVTFERDVALSEKSRLLKLLDQSTSAGGVIAASKDHNEEKTSYGSLAEMSLDELCRESRSLFDANR
ncbi:hypothetical protein AAVH_43235 [Aphelenchoides avenae]|nr:hypothetical protein AAVH_43235 [Aphelenchus avenae]